MTSPSGSRCTLVVPCYNEAERLDVAAFERALDRLPGLEFLFVNDGSRDGTLELLTRMRPGREDRITVLDKQQNAGKAEAVRDGLLMALADPGVACVGFWDADLATPLEEVPAFLAVLGRRPEVEMVFGARVKLLGRQVHRRAARHYLGRLFASAASLMLGLPIYDTQCGAKVFRATPALAEILAEPFRTRWVFDVELIARYIRHAKFDRAAVAGAIYELPLARWEDVAGSKVGAADFLLAFKDMLRIYFAYLRP